MPTDQMQNLLSSLLSDLFWGEVGDRSAWLDYFKHSDNRYYMELPNRMIVERNHEERLKYIPTGRYARFVKVPEDMVVQSMSYNNLFF